MPRFKPHFVVTLLTFAAGVAAASLWLSPRPAPTLEPAEPPRAAAPTTSAQSAPEADDQCRWAREAGQTLPRLYEEYANVAKAPSVEKLVALDNEVRRLFNGRPEYYPCSDDAGLWEAKYAEMGVELGHFGSLLYSGKLLADAHRMNPDSRLRSHTLFSTVEREHGFGVMPNVSAARAYAKEFPRGPFIEETLLVLADFNKDLYMVLRDDLRDYKYDCFKPHTDRSPRLSQASRARANAVGYYEKALRVNPANARAKKFLEEVKKGTVRAWSFCAD